MLALRPISSGIEVGNDPVAPSKLGRLTTAEEPLRGAMNDRDFAARQTAPERVRRKVRRTDPSVGLATTTVLRRNKKDRAPLPCLPTVDTSRIYPID